MASKTYKQWADYHYKRLKKLNPGATDNILKIMAGDAAARSFEAQKAASTSAQSALSDKPEALTSNRVGPEAPKMEIPATPKGATKPSTATLPPTLQPITSMMAPGGATYNDRIQQRLQATNSSVPALFPRFTAAGASTPTGLNAPDFLKTLSGSDYTTIRGVLKQMGYRVAADKGAVNKLLTESFSELFPVLSANALIKKLQDRVIGGGAAEGQLPQRQIQKVDRQTLVDIAQTVARNGFMQELDEAKLNEVVNAWEKKANQGVLTTTKKVRNPKTGKLEQVTTTTRGFQQATEEKKLEEKLKKEMPQQYELSQGISFIDDIKSILAGGM